MDLTAVDAECDQLIGEFIDATLADPARAASLMAFHGSIGDPVRGGRDVFLLALLAHRTGDTARAQALCAQARDEQATHIALLTDCQARPRARDSVPVWHAWELTSTKTEAIAHLIEDAHELAAQIDALEALITHAPTVEAIAADIDTQGISLDESITRRRRARINAARPHMHARLARGEHAAALAGWTEATGSVRSAELPPIAAQEWVAAERICAAESELAPEERSLDLVGMMSGFMRAREPRIARDHLAGHLALIGSTGRGATSPFDGYPYGWAHWHRLRPAEDVAALNTGFHAMLRTPERFAAMPGRAAADDATEPLMVVMPAEREAYHAWTATQAGRAGWQGQELWVVPSGGTHELWAVSMVASVDASGRPVGCVACLPLSASRKRRPDRLEAEVRAQAALRGVPAATAATLPVRHGVHVRSGVNVADPDMFAPRVAPAPLLGVIGHERCDHRGGSWRPVAMRGADGRTRYPIGAALDCPRCQRIPAGIVGWERVPAHERDWLRHHHDPDPMARTYPLAPDDPARELRIARYRARLCEQELPADITRVRPVALDRRMFAVEPTAAPRGQAMSLRGTLAGR